jgi:hypothetical protein
LNRIAFSDARPYGWHLSGLETAALKTVVACGVGWTEYDAWDFVWPDAFLEQCIQCCTLAISLQFCWLLVLAIPVACVAWTITHEEIFRETRDYCHRQSTAANTLPRRKFFYLFTCEYCFSHYIAALFLFLTGFKLLYDGWRGSLIAFFSLVWIANQYMSIYNHLRLDIKHEQVQIKAQEQVQTKAREKEENDVPQEKAA